MYKWPAPVPTLSLTRSRSLKSGAQPSLRNFLRVVMLLLSTVPALRCELRRHPSYSAHYHISVPIRHCASESLVVKQCWIIGKSKTAFQVLQTFRL